MSLRQILGRTPLPRVLLAGAVGFTAVGVAGLPVVAAQTPPATEAAAAANLAWEPCFQGDGAFQCATLEVPLDHSNPSSNRIPIALIRQRATDPSRRIGSLVLNPGGPGGSGVDFLRAGRAVHPH